MELRLFLVSCLMYGFAWISQRLIKRDKLAAPRAFAGWHFLYLGCILSCALYLLLFVMSGGPGGIFPTGKFIIGLVAVLCYSLYDYRKTLRLTQEERTPVIKSALDWCNTVYFAGFVASIIMFFFIQAFKIPSASMRDTLLEGDHLFVNKTAYGIRIPFSTKRIAAKEIQLWRQPI